MIETAHIVALVPPHFAADILASPLKPEEADAASVERLLGAIEMLQYNTPVARFGRVYHLIVDRMGGMVLTQNGNIIAQADRRHVQVVQGRGRPRSRPRGVE